MQNTCKMCKWQKQIWKEDPFISVDISKLHITTLNDNSGCSLSLVFLLKVLQRSKQRNGRSPLSNVTAKSQRNHNRGPVWVEKNEWESKKTHSVTQKNPSAPWADSHRPTAFPLLLSRLLLCFLQQEPVAETWQCAGWCKNCQRCD